MRFRLVPILLLGVFAAIGIVVYVLAKAMSEKPARR